MNVVEITKDLFYVGASDRTLSRFETIYPIPDGMAYHSYLLKDSKNVLLDTVDASVSEAFFGNLEQALEDGVLDYIIVNHMEPDHSFNLLRVLEKYPLATIVCSTGAANMMSRYLSRDFSTRTQIVKEGDTLNIGRHTLQFFMAPMVHWPEVMVTFDTCDGTLFSADAFGSFGAVEGELNATSLNLDREWTPEARRYYANIVGKYGAQVMNLLERVGGQNIARICPLHGKILTSNLNYFLDKYTHWATYTPEAKAVVIAYGSIYGHTRSVAELLARELEKNGVSDVSLFDVSTTHGSVILGECFRASHLVFASVTYNGGIFPPMENLILAVKAHGLANRVVSFIQSGSWAPVSRRLMQELLAGQRNFTIVDNALNILCAPTQDQKTAVEQLAREFALSLGLCE